MRDFSRPPRIAEWLTIIVVALLLLSLLPSGARANHAGALCHQGVSARVAIRCHFGSGYRGRQALALARCESGLDYRARHGIYWGLFQVSPNLRRDYSGFAWSSYAQARHARRIYNDSGWFHWSGWGCM